MIGNGTIKNRALAMTGASAKIMAYLTTLGITSAAELTFAQKLKLTTMALWEQAAAWAASPLGMATIAAVGIFALVKVIDLVTVSLEESREKLAELKEEYSENESKLSSLNDELKTTRARIAELQGMGTITVTETAELENLRSYSAELERQIFLLDTIQRKKNEERNRTFVDTMKKDLEDSYEWTYGMRNASTNYEPQNHTSKLGGAVGLFYDQMDERDYINAVLLRREELLNELADNSLSEQEKAKLDKTVAEIDEYLLEKQQEFAETADGISRIADPTTGEERELNAYLDFIDDFNDRMTILWNENNPAAKAQAQTQAFIRLINQSFSDTTSELKELGKQGQVTATHFDDDRYDAFIAKCIELGIITDTSANSLGFLARAFNELSSSAAGAGSGVGNTVQTTAQTLQDSLDTINEKIDDVQSRLSTLSDALAKLRDGSLGVNDVIDLLQQFPELAAYVDLTSENFGNLEQGLRNLIQASPDDLIEDLKKLKETKDLTADQKYQIDNLCEALTNLPTDAIKDVAGEFGVLAKQIQAATTAQTELEKKLSEDDYDKGYKGRVSAYTGFQEVVESGEFGSKAYAAYKEYFGLEKKDSAAIQQWLKDNERYFSEESDGKAGIIAFLEAVEQRSKADKDFAKLASYDSATGVFWYDINQLDGFAKQMDWTSEMLQDFIYKYRMYCEEWESRSAQESLDEFVKRGLVIDIGSESFAYLDELRAATGLSKDEVVKLLETINQLREQQGKQPIQLIGSDQIHITQSLIDNLMETHKDADVVKEKLAEMAVGAYTIEVGAQLEGDPIDEVLASLVNPDEKLLSFEVTMNVNGEEVIQKVTATVSEVKKILGEDWEAKLNSDDAQVKADAIKKLCDGLSEDDVVVTIKDDTEQARSSLSELNSQLNDIIKNKNQTITITTKYIDQEQDYQYQGSGSKKYAEHRLRVYASGTYGAKAGPALLGDEPSADGSPKPELVVSNGRAYIAGVNGPEIGYLNDGDIVYTADETKKILKGNVLGKSFPAYAGGTASPILVGGIAGVSSGTTKLPGAMSGFDELYKYHQHMLEMDEESVADYLDWLDDAYQKAYEDGIIDLDDYYKY